jgi:hypothetical protein
MSVPTVSVCAAEPESQWNEDGINPRSIKRRAEVTMNRLSSHAVRLIAFSARSCSTTGAAFPSESCAPPVAVDGGVRVISNSSSDLVEHT